MSATTYREETAFEIATGTRALTELRRAAHPGLAGWGVLYAIGVVGIVGVVAAGRWHVMTSFVLSIAAIAVGVQVSLVSMSVARKQMEHVRRTRGSLEEDGIVLESDGGGRTRWSWDRVTFARRTRTALTIFTDTEWGIVIFADVTPNLDRIAEIATSRARASWRAPSRWMLAVVLAQILLTAIAARPQALATPEDRVADALDRHVDPMPRDVETLAFGTLCERATLSDLLDANDRARLAPAYEWLDEDALVLAARDLGRCDEGVFVPRGRVLTTDASLGPCTYFAFTIRDEDRWALVGPYCTAGDDPWTHPAQGAFTLEDAMTIARTMQTTIIGRPPARTSFSIDMRDPNE